MLRNAIATALVLAAFSATTAVAAPWSGNATNFQYASTPGGDGGTLFSAPSQSGNALTFNTNGFSATSVAGTPDAVNGFVEFEVDIDAGFTLDFVTAAVVGNINVSDPGSMVDLDVTWEVRDLANLNPQSQSITGTTPISFPHNFAGDATDTAVFTGDNTLGGLGSVLPPLGQTVIVRLDIGAIAESTTGSANINVFGSGLELGFFFVPEPATASLMIIGGLALIRRRRS